MAYQIFKGDVREMLEEVEDNSIACSIWSPPYHVGKEYERGVSFKEWQLLLREVIKKHFRVIQPGGFIAINIADILCFSDKGMPKIQALNISRQRSKVTREDVLKAKENYPDYNRYQLAKLLGCSEQTIDRRLNGNNIRGGKYATQTRVQLTGGIIQEVGMDAGFYLYDRRVWAKDPAWENSKWHTLSYRSIDEFEYIYIFWKPGETVVDRNKLTRKEWKEWGSRAIWKIPSVRSNDDHEAKFPKELPRRLIKLFSAKDDAILDCFLGSGTTGMAAIEEGRNFIGIELMEKYVELAENNLKNAVRKARQQTLELYPKEEKQVEFT